MNKLSDFNDNVKLVEFMSHLFKVERKAIDIATRNYVTLNLTIPVNALHMRVRFPIHDFTSSFFNKQNDNNNQ